MVVSITPLRSSKGAAAAAHYYSPENPRRPDEYYGSAEVELPTVWWSPRGTMGVENGAVVKPEQLREAMAGRDPRGTGERLVQFQDRKVLDKRTGERKLAERRMAHDFTFTMPASASIVAAAMPPEDRREFLLGVRSAALEVMMELHNRNAFVCREGKGGVRKAPAHDVMAVAAVHQTSRSGMPMIHCHIALLAPARAVSGKTRALELIRAFDAKAESGALFRAQVAAMLERRGARMQRVPGKARQRLDTFRVAGVPEALERAMTLRSRAMLESIAARGEEVAEHGAKRRRQMRNAARATRGNKAAVPVGEKLERRWQATFRNHGLDGQALWERVREAGRTVERSLLSPAEAVALGVEKTRAVLDHALLRRRVAEEAQFTGGASRIAEALREGSRIVRDGWQRVAEMARERMREIGNRAREALLEVSAWAARRERDTGGGGGDSDASTPHRRRRGQNQGQER